MLINLISHQELLETLSYSAETGIFTWKKSPKQGFKAGAKAGCGQKHGHVAIKINNNRYYAHRLAWFYVHKEWPKYDIDHIDGNPENNKIENLRDVNRAVNIQNQRKAHKNNKLGVMGVRESNGRFRAEIRVKGKAVFLGMFDTTEDAYGAYLNAKRKLHAGCEI